MISSVKTLLKMLDLEQNDFDLSDRAVSGGLARFASSWRSQSLNALNNRPGTEAWVAAVTASMTAYSQADQGDRLPVLEHLRVLLNTGPAAFVGAEETPASETPQAPVYAAEAVQPEDQAAPPVEAAAPATQQAPLPPQTVEPSEPDNSEPFVILPPEPETPPAPAYKPYRVAGRGLFQNPRYIKGVGEVNAERMAALNVNTIHDVLRHYPHRYEDYSKLKTINHLEVGELVNVLAKVWDVSVRKSKNGTPILSAVVSDETGTLRVTWFNATWHIKNVQPGIQLQLRGKVTQHLGYLTLNQPDYNILGRNELSDLRINPVYPTTEGLTQKVWRSAVENTLEDWASRVPDPLPATLCMAHQLAPLDKALWGIHFPDSEEHLAVSRRRLAFEESLYLQLGLLQQKLKLKAQPGQSIQIGVEKVEGLLEALPFQLTGAQRRSLDEMLADFASGVPMNRLLQGDVGSGKTAVAALLMALSADQGYQAALMAPTEILAEQHYRSLGKLFADFPDGGPSLGLLTGSVQGEERQAVYEGLADGSLQVVVGTHALIQDAVSFKNLGFAVIDEQHRFGVEQRGALRNKAEVSPHVLVMTATPIPRSLELTVWGHLDVSILDEMPPGRQPIETHKLQPLQRERAYAFVRGQIEQGRQAFIIYPLVEESESVDAPAAVQEHARLQESVFPRYKVGLLHGQMRSQDKDAAMTAFMKGETQILVATSVVEVGIDVPNATVMLIEGADRFGLAQLHQFRGRVGRGEHQSYCLLLADSVSETASERLDAVVATNDGFELAEKDLQMRGPGEFLGTQQSGFPELPMRMFTDTRLLHEVRQAAVEILTRDPELILPEHAGIREEVSAFWDSTGDVS